MRKEVSFSALEEMKFEVVQRFGVTRNRYNYRFFIQETVEPTQYGDDCQDSIWYEVPLLNLADLKALSDFLKELFSVEIELSSTQEARKAVNALNKDMSEKAQVADWGACTVIHLPINERFRKSNSNRLDFTNTSSLVKDILSSEPTTRNSDNHLFHAVCKYLLSNQGIDINGLRFSELFLSLKDYGLPQFETVGRIRRKLQNEYPELQCNEVVGMEKSLIQDSFRDYMKEGA